MASEEHHPQMIGTRQASRALGISQTRVRALCNTGHIIGATRQDDGAWAIPTPVQRNVPSVYNIIHRPAGQDDAPEPSSIPVYVNAGQAAQELGVTTEIAVSMCEDNEILGAVQAGRDWMIPSPVGVIQYASINEAAEILCMAPRHVRRMCRSGQMVNAQWHNGRWRIRKPVQILRRAHEWPSNSVR